jgi:alcohol dehydrogenase (cytochrome c)
MPRVSSKLIAALAMSLAGAGAAYAAVAQLAPATVDPEGPRYLAQRHAVLSKLTPVTDAMLRNPPAADWLQWRRTYDQHGFSPLTQINKQNVKTLHSAWTWSLPPGTSEITPLVHDGIMYVYGNMDRIQALDATNGELLWEYAHPAPEGPNFPGMAGTYRKNLTLYRDKLYFTTYHGYEVALDAKTGKLVWQTQFGTVAAPYRASSAPLPVNGKLLQGVANCSRQQPGGCFLVAFDADTGKELWKLNTVAHPGDPGGDTWGGAPVEDRQGASIWTTPSYDPELNLAYVGTGNSYAWQLFARGDTKRDPKKDALYISSTLAVNPDTGKMEWYFQHLPQSMWNQDWVFEHPIITLNVKGKPQKVVVSTGKLALTEALDAKTGKFAFAIDQGLQNLVQSIDPVTGAKTYNPAAVPDLTRQRTNLMCGDYKNWPASAYNASTKMLYMIILDEGCSEQLPQVFDASNVYAGGAMETSRARPQPGKTDGMQGHVDAINLETGKTVWSKRQRAPLASAALATAGGLVFAGDGDRWFRAYDQATGDVLWQSRLAHTVNNFPITYSVNGKQYVAVAAGQGLSQKGNLEIQWPRERGAVMHVFELPNQ